MENVKGFFFDVGGTVFDWKNTARENIQELADEKGESIDSEAFANDWRREMFKIHTQVRQGNLPWINSDDMHLRALESMAANYPILRSIDNAALIRSTWHHLLSLSLPCTVRADPCSSCSGYLQASGNHYPTFFG